MIENDQKGKKEITPEKAQDFFEKVAVLGAGVKVSFDGAQYVDQVSFWDWMNRSYLQSGYFSSPEAALKCLLDRPDWTIKQLQGKGYEWAGALKDKNDISNIGARVILTDDPTQSGVDSTIKNFFNGGEIHKQYKNYPHDTVPRARDFKHTPQDAIVVGPKDKIDSWNTGGHPKEAFLSSDKAAEIPQDRKSQVIDGKAYPIKSFEFVQGAMKQIGRGAVIGAVVCVGVSTLSNYSRFEKGEITGGELVEILLKDSTKGALTGGTIAAINIPVQLAAQWIGVGNPITIPVMIVISAGLQEVLGPIFKEGRYAEYRSKIGAYRDLSQAWLAYADMSYKLYHIQKDYLKEVALHLELGDHLDRGIKMQGEQIEDRIRRLKK